jgi:Cu/Ag efflux pump CusA
MSRFQQSLAETAKLLTAVPTFQCRNQSVRRRIILPLVELDRKASISRVRPKLMTASCAMLGLLPLVLLAGHGGELERPLAIVMIGGLMTSTLFTLLALPTFYSLIVGLKSRWRRVPSVAADNKSMLR